MRYRNQAHSEGGKGREDRILNVDRAGEPKKVNKNKIFFWNVWKNSETREEAD